MIEKGIFIPDREQLTQLTTNLKAAGCRVVLTQGTYDLLHDGHCKYLEMARAQGDVLIVGVDSDAKVKKRKGPNRPIVPEVERVNILTYLRSVDFITLKHVDEERYCLLKQVHPDVLVVSQSTGDRKFDEEAVRVLEQFCGKVVILEPQSVNSTSARLRLLNLTSREKLGKKLATAFPAFVKQLEEEILKEEGGKP